MADVPGWNILQACVDQTREHVDLTGENGTPGIPNERVISMVVPYSRDPRQRQASINRPAVVWTPPRSVDTPAAAGNNCQAVSMYTVLCQILHTDLSVQAGPVMRNVLKWEYNIRRYFHMGNLRQAVFDEDGFVTLAPVQKVDVTNEKLFHVFDDAVALIPVTFKCLEPHSTDGRT